MDKSPMVMYTLTTVDLVGHVAEWLRRGLQILVSQFDSGRGLQLFKWPSYFFCVKTLQIENLTLCQRLMLLVG